MFYIMATIAIAGLEQSVISEFQNAQKMRRFAREVMSGGKALPVWRKISDMHPQSGEEVLVRNRSFISGAAVMTMEVVQPREGYAGRHGYDPANFESVPEIKSAGYGFWTCPEDDAPEGAVVGARYPVKRDTSDQRRFVTLRIAEGETAERRHYLDAERVGVTSLGASDDEDFEDDNIDFEDFESEDED